MRSGPVDSLRVKLFNGPKESLDMNLSYISEGFVTLV